MLQIAPQMRILVAIEAVDLRKGIDGLAELCREKLSADPFSGACVSKRASEISGMRERASDCLSRVVLCGAASGQP